MTSPVNASPKNDAANFPCFPPGQVVATPAALAALNEYGFSPSTLLTRHLSGDWGDALPPEDAALNDQALLNGNRILSSYQIAPRLVVWVITEWDRSVSTLLLPDDY